LQDEPHANPFEIGASLTDAGVLPYGLQDIERLRLLVQGDSVIDWRRLAFRDYEDVDAFLELCGFRANHPGDALRLAYIHRVAFDYVQTNLDIELATSVRSPEDIRDLLLDASRAGPAQRDACVVLKVMHVIHHVSGRELLYRLPVPTNELFHRIETKVFDAIDGMKARGIRVAEFAGSRKSPESILTKLLCRPDSLAAEVHDRLRFRVVTESLDDLFAAMVYVTRHLLPFTYVVPGESRNDLFDLLGTIERDPRLRQIGGLLQDTTGAADRRRQNVFSHRGFRMVNFVVDMPVRVDDLVGLLPGFAAQDGCVVFLLVEFQLVDRETDRINSTGESRHDLYKDRQLARVAQRLRGVASHES